MPKTAIVILNWNGIGYLKSFLETTIRHSSIEDAEIVIADNGSTDGSALWIEETHKELRLIRLEKNLGFAGGYNAALSQVDAEYYILLNSDIEVTCRWLQPLISFMDDNPRVASCQPKIRSWGKRDHFEYAGAAGGFIDKYGFPFCRGRIFDHIERDTGQYNDQMDIFWSTGACMAVRASAWEHCGGFDQSFFAHMEEIDLCWRFHKAGYRVSYVPGSVVYHVGGGALPYNSPFKTYLNFRNNLYLLHKNLPEAELTKILYLRRLFDGLAALMFLFRGKMKLVKSIWKAHNDYYKNIEDLNGKRAFVQSLIIEGNSAPVLNKSVVFEFYARGRKTYSSLRMIDPE
jgi:GT2 family glycosyltransferase